MNGKNKHTWLHAGREAAPSHFMRGLNTTLECRIILYWVEFSCVLTQSGVFPFWRQSLNGVAFDFCLIPPAWCGDYAIKWQSIAFRLQQSSDLFQVFDAIYCVVIKEHMRPPESKQKRCVLSSFFFFFFWWEQNKEQTSAFQNFKSYEVPTIVKADLRSMLEFAFDEETSFLVFHVSSGIWVENGYFHQKHRIGSFELVFTFAAVDTAGPQHLNLVTIFPQQAIMPGGVSDEISCNSEEYFVGTLHLENIHTHQFRSPRLNQTPLPPIW